MTKTFLVSTVLALGLCGCANFREPPLGPDNPANPAAHESAPSSARPTLRPDALTRKTNAELGSKPPAGSDVSGAVHEFLGRTLTADGAVRIALLNNRELQASLDEVGVAKADLVEAGLLSNPSFMASPRFPDSPPSSADVELSVTQDFLDVLLLPLRKKVAAARVEQARLRVSEAALALARDVKSAAYSLEAAESLLARVQAFLAADAAALDLSQRQHEAGTTNDLALANQQAAYSEDRLEVATAEAEIREKRERLNHLMNLWGDETNWKIAPELPPIPASEANANHLESLAVAQRPDIAEAKSNVMAVAQALGIGKTYRYFGTVEIGVDTETQTDRQRITGPTFNISLPLFNRGQGRIAKLEAQLRQAENRLEGVAIAARSEVREARDRLLAKRDAALFYRDELAPERARIVQLTQDHYNAMLAGPYDLLLAKQNELAAERSGIEAQRDYWIARADLEYAAGGTLNPRKTPEPTP